MADTKLSALTSATPAAGDLVYLVQNGNSRRATAQGIANLAPAANLSYDATTRVLSSSTGEDATLPLATTTLAGLLSAADKVKLDGGQAQAQTVTITVRNNSGSTIGKGVPVYVTGSSGTTITIAPADASAEATAAETLGLTAASIANNADGTVIAVGLLDGVNTAALTEGQIIWLGETTGGLTTTRPTQPAHGVVVGYCVKQGSGTSGIIYVKVDNGLELTELHDVLVTGATAGQFLQLAADGLWKARTFVATDISNSTTAGRALLTAASTAAQRSALELGTAAQAATTDFASAAQGALAATAVQPAGLTSYVQTSDARLSDSREWSAATVTQAQAEAGTSTSRLAFTPQRVFQAVAAYIAANFSAVGQALATAANAAAARTTLGLGSAATSATTDFAAASHTQAASTISDSTAAGRALLTAADAAAQRAALQVVPADAAPQPLGAAAIGSSADYAREDHVHAMPSAADVGALPVTFTPGTITYAAQVTLDMAALAGGYRTISLAGALEFLTSNRASGRTVTLRLICDATQRALTFPAGWVFVGTKPSTIAASKTAVLSLTFFGTADTDCVAAYGVQA